MGFVLKDGVAYLNTTDFVEKATDGLDAVLVAAGWERSTKGQQVSGVSGATDRVYFSSGENGLEAIFLRITQSGENLDFRAYSFWNPAGTAGEHVVGDTAGATRITGVAGALVGWIAADKNGVGIVLRTAAGTYRKCYAGILDRHIPPQYSGQTIISNGGLGAASGQALVKVASVTNLTAGQDVWIVNQLAGANVANLERKTIQSIDSGTKILTLTGNLANNYDDGALVALDPQPVLLWFSSTGASEVFVASTNRYMLNHADAYPGPGTPLGAAFLAQTHIEDQGLGTFNPDDFGQWDVEDFLVYDSTAGRLWRRGYLGRFARIETGAGFVDEDVGRYGTDDYLLMQENDGTWVGLRKAA